MYDDPDMTHDEKRVRDLMTPDPVAASPATPIAELGALMREHECRHVPIVDQNRLVGVVSTKDLARAGSIAADVMTRSPIAVAPDTPLGVAAAMIAIRKVGCLLVVENGTLVGIVTTYDLLDAFARHSRAP